MAAKRPHSHASDATKSIARTRMRGEQSTREPPASNRPMQNSLNKPFSDTSQVAGSHANDTGRKPREAVGQSSSNLQINHRRQRQQPLKAWRAVPNVRTAITTIHNRRIFMKRARLSVGAFCVRGESCLLGTWDSLHACFPDDQAMCRVLSRGAVSILPCA